MSTYDPNLPPSVSSRRIRLRRFLDRFGLRSWSFVAFGVGGSAARVVDLLTGLLIIRAISPEGYAVYAIATGSAPIYAIILVSGILPAIWRRVGREAYGPPQIEVLRRAGEMSLYRRNKVIFPMILVTAVALVWQVTGDWVQLVAGSLGVMALATVSAHQTITEGSLQLARKQMTVLSGAILQSAFRMLSLLFLLVGDAAIIPLIFSASLAVFVNYLFCRRALSQVADGTTMSSLLGDELDRDVVELRQKSFYTDLFQSVSGQFYYWVLAFFTGPVGVSSFSAIARLGQATYPLTILFRGFFVPGFARLSQNSALGRHFFALAAVSVGVAFPVVAFTVWVPDAVLMILGPNYSELRLALMLYAVGLLFWLVSDLADQLLRSRGLFMPPMIGIPLDTAAFALPFIVARGVTVELAFSSFITVAVVRVLRLGAFAAISFRRQHRVPR